MDSGSTSSLATRAKTSTPSLVTTHVRAVEPVVPVRVMVRSSDTVTVYSPVRLVPSPGEYALPLIMASMQNEYSTTLETRTKQWLDPAAQYLISHVRNVAVGLAARTLSKIRDISPLRL